MPDDFVFATAAQLDGLRAQAQIDEWVAVHESFFWAMDFTQPEDGRFVGSVSALAVGSVGVAKLDASFTSGVRERSHILRDMQDNYTLSINAGHAPLYALHGGRESNLEIGDAVLLNGSEPFRFAGAYDKTCINIAVPRGVFAAAVRDADSQLGLHVGANTEALTLLRRYCHMLRSGEPLRSAELQAHASETIVDLIALASGVDGEFGDLANMRGLRAGRLASVLQRIRTGFTGPDFSAQVVARELSLSARYVQDLLAETGQTFAERVLELRLQQVRSQLTDRRHDTRRVSEIAYAAGFNDISYFNRCFRRRFGAAPGTFR
jgi:AraC-like DNA-binding protein